MRNILICIIAIVFCLSSHGERQGRPIGDDEVAASSFSAAAATALSKADVALARSYVVRNAFKGSFGESIAEKSYIDTYLTKDGHWQSITPRAGPQGLDHLFIKTKNGVIQDVMVGESKFNTSALNKNTQDGIQMGDAWIGKRLKRLAWRYNQVSQLQEIGLGKPPLNSVRKLCVVLKNGKKVYFWTEGYKWKFSGTEAELSEAKLRASQYGNYFDRASAGLVKYRSRVFNIVPKGGNDVEIRIYDAKNIANGNLHAAKPQAVLKFEGALLSKGAISESEMAAQIQRKLGLSDADSIAYARKVLKQYNSRALMGEFSLAKSVIVNSATATAVGAAIDVAIQLISTGEVDYAALGMNAGGVFLGTTAGQLTHIALTRPVTYNLVQRISGPLHCSTPMATSLLSSMAGGVATSAFLSYGAYFLGYADLKTANRGMFLGTVSSGAGAAFTGGALCVAGWGTASTGTAIAELSGAAATSAKLAWLGGGAVSAGGGGAALGTVVLTGGAVVVAAAVGAIGYYGYKMYDQHEDTVRICSELSLYQTDGQSLDAALRNDHRYVEMLCAQ